MCAVDTDYFRSYDDPDIHDEMVKDEARMDSYRAALNQLSHEKSVIDVGAGTGVLSLMAMDAGAKCVYAIEKSQIAKRAQDAFGRRKDKNKMMVFNGRAEEFTLGRSKADLLVSEWMGYFLIFERMLPSVIAVRDSCLKKDGEIVPYEAELFIAGCSGELQSLSGQSSGNDTQGPVDALI